MGVMRRYVTLSTETTSSDPKPGFYQAWQEKIYKPNHPQVLARKRKKLLKTKQLKGIRPAFCRSRAPATRII
jgi:hypothetical protein